MSGHSFDTNCPNCDGVIYAYSDHKPFQFESGECHDCGFHYYTVAKQMDLKTLNAMRTDEEYHGEKQKPLKKLPKIEKWLKPYLTKEGK
tara:strand:+ start:542 stop:808 length:267 start_codon:yes stop_codon:yes gene_type:complete